MRRALTSLLLVSLFLAPVALGQVVKTVAGGGPNDIPAVDANLSSPLSVATDSAGNTYIGVSGRIFKVDSMGQLTVLAGNGLCGNSGDNGPAVNAMLCSPIAVAVDTAGNVFFSDSSFQRIRRVEAATGIITTVVGTGSTGFSGDGGLAKNATINGPWGLAFDSMGNLFLNDRINQRIRKVQASGGLVDGNGIISTIAGTGTAGFGGDGGPASAALLNFPLEIAFDPSDNLYIVDGGNRIRRIDALSGNISTIAGNGTLGYGGEGATATATPLGSPIGVEADGTGHVFIAESGNQRVRRIDLALNKIFTVAGNGTSCSSTGLCGDGGAATAAQLSGPRSLAFDNLGRLLIADSNTNRVRRVDLGINTIVAFAGNRTPGFAGEGTLASGASLSTPFAVVFDQAGNLFLADSSNRRVRRIDAVTGIITTVAGDGNSCSPTTAACGDGGLATTAKVQPIALTFDSAGNLFLSDSGTRRVRRVAADTMTGLITASSTISTVVGNGNACAPSTDACGDGGAATGAALSGPVGLEFDSLGNLFVADQSANKIRKVASGPDGFVTGSDPAEIISTIAGTGVSCASSTDPCGDGGTATSATFRNPWGLAIDSLNNLFISDQSSHRIRKVAAGADGQITGASDPGELITTAAGTGALFSGSCFTSSDGPATTRTFCIPRAIAFDGSGNLWVAEAGGHVIRRINAVGGLITAASTVTRVMGTGGAGFNGDGMLPINTTLASPSGVAVDMLGNFYVADSSNNRIRTVDNNLKPAPTLSFLNQTSLPFNWTTTNFNLPVFGTNFVPDSVVRWNGMDRVTTYINQGRVDATIPPSDFAMQGVFPVTVFTSGPGGGTSNALNFTVTKRSVSQSFGCATMTPGATSTCSVTISDFGSGTRGLPTGSINFTTSSAGTLSAGSCTLAQSGTNSANCQITYTPDVGTEGQTHSITAMYSGDGDYFSATNNTSQVVRRATSVSVVCTPSSVPVNSPTTCTATSTDLSPGAAAPPDGTVTWSNFSQGTYDPTSCVLTPISGTASSCTTTFTPSPNFAQSGLSICTSTAFSGPPRVITSGSTCGFITAASRSTSTTMTCAPNPIPMGGTTTCTLTVTDTAPGTPLTPPGIASYFTNRLGSFSPVSPCASSGSGSSFSCSFDYTASSSFNNNGTHNLTGNYSTQVNPNYANRVTHSASSQVFQLTVQDPTPPVVTPTITGTLGDNGWYRSNVTVSWTRTDPETTITSVTGCSTTSVTTDTAGVTFSCSATSGGGTTSQSVTIKRDTTNPTLSFGAATPAANANGWQNADVSFSFTASDATSGVASTSVPSPLPLTAEGTAVNGAVTVTDNAGNTATFTSPTVKIDKTPPSASASRSPAANANGWNNVDVTVSYACSDALSGLAAGSPPAATVVSTEGANQSASGTCSDRAGNSATATMTDINIDKTPPTVAGTPSPAANGFGWNNTDVTVSFSCNDALSGPAAGTTSADVVLAAEGASQSAAGSCLDQAGNSGSTTVGEIHIDKTPPSASASASPAPNPNGWNNTDVTVSFTGNDGLSGVDTCAAPVVLASEGAGQSASGDCTDKAGNTGPPSTAGGIHIDKTAPTITGNRSPAASAFGWNNTDVTASFACSDALSGLAAGSPPGDTVLSAEGAAQSASGACSDLAGNTATDTVSGINIDKTPPTATGTPSRTPDSNGWYNSAFSVNWSGADALAGIDSCGAAHNFSGPDTSTGSFSGTCTDKAGNPGNGLFNFKYDATPPVVTITTPPNLATYTPGQTVAANYSCADPMAGVNTCAGTVANGANINTATTGNYTFTVNATDEAGNASSRTNAYSVGPQYTFIGFLQPVDNLPTINQAKPGRTIPVKWQIKDAAGNFVSDLSTLASLLSGPIACEAAPTAIVEEQLNSPGSTVFRYDATTNQFIYNWQSASNWRGCRLLQVTLSDGTQHWAKFNFK